MNAFVLFSFNPRRVYPLIFPVAVSASALSAGSTAAAAAQFGAFAGLSFLTIPLWPICPALVCQPRRSILPCLALDTASLSKRPLADLLLHLVLHPHVN